MRTKTYNIKIKMICETEMMVSEKSMQKALLKVNGVLTDLVNKKKDLSKTFDKPPFFVYKAELINVVNKEEEKWMD